MEEAIYASVAEWLHSALHFGLACIPKCRVADVVIHYFVTDFFQAKVPGRDNELLGRQILLRSGGWSLEVGSGASLLVT